MLTAGMLAFAACTKDEGVTSSETSSVETVLTGLVQIGDAVDNDSYTVTYYGEEGSDSTVAVVEGKINEDFTFTKELYWVLDGRVFVTGAELTIEAGTIVMGETGTGLDASSLVIATDGTINATGTSSSPIIFTTVIDNIMLGDLSGTNLDESNRGLWGGLVLLGESIISATGTGATAQIEGIPTTETLGAYGGTTDDDNSGVLSYISIRHGGASIEADKEINGLTLGGVGSGTTVNNIEIIGNSDDGIEFFGGSVNVTNLLIWNVTDDGIDIDQSYSGTVSNFYVITDGGVTDNCLEIDGPESTTNATGFFTLINGRIEGPGTTSTIVDALAFCKSSAQGTIENVYWTNFNAADHADADGQAIILDGSSDITFTLCQFDDAYAFYNESSTATIISTTAANGMQQVSADPAYATLSDFDWTYAAESSAGSL